MGLKNIIYRDSDDIQGIPQEIRFKIGNAVNVKKENEDS